MRGSGGMVLAERGAGPRVVGGQREPAWHAHIPEAAAQRKWRRPLGSLFGGGIQAPLHTALQPDKEASIGAIHVPGSIS